MMSGQLLIPTHILHALNALQYLRARHIMADSVDQIAYSGCEEIAETIGASEDSLWRTLLQLKRAKIIQAKMGKDGGYYITPQAVTKYRVVDVLRALGKALPVNGNARASDKLNNTVADCLDITLEEFFK